MTTRTAPVLLVWLLACSLWACHRHQAVTAQSIMPDTLVLRPGDVVFRRCTGLTSRIVAFQDTGGIFSHTGIVVDSAGVMMIVHAVPGEHDFRGDADRVKMDTPQKFYAKGYALTGAVCRPYDSIAGKRAARKAMEIYQRGTLFDNDYDETDTTRMYCTELIAYAYRHAGIELLDSQRHTVSLPLTKIRCIVPSQIYKSQQLQQMYMFNP